MTAPNWKPYNWPDIRSSKPGEWDSYGSDNGASFQLETPGRMSWPESDFVIQSYENREPTIDVRETNMPVYLRQIGVGGDAGGGGVSPSALNDLREWIERLSAMMNDFIEGEPTETITVSSAPPHDAHPGDIWLEGNVLP